MTTRYLAWTELQRHGSESRIGTREAVAKESNPRMRARALQLLARIQGNAKYVDQALKDKDADIRITGLAHRPRA